MKAVIYTDDMEPITIINITEQIAGYLREQGRVSIPVMPPLGLEPMADPPRPVRMDEPPIVTIFAEQLARKGKRHMLLVTGNEESALLLRCAFLPGQTQGLKERERVAFAKGILETLNQLSR